MNKYQVIVLSGGGAKGPYGLGVLLALEKFHKERKWEITKIYCGTSIGALNATLAAQNDLKGLSKLYSELHTKSILGTKTSQVSTIGILLARYRRPFFYFKNDALRLTIENNVNYKKLQNSHLLICATNYLTGDLETFYTSSLVDEFLESDQSLKPDDQRLRKFHRIESQEQLVQALLASTAIPFYFPPVKIKDRLYVDGGVGNNTPLRQAAYVCRYLHEKAGCEIEPTFCVINDPQGFSIEPEEANDMFGVVRRTMDIFHNELISDSHRSWLRIDNELRSAEDKENILHSNIDVLQSLSQAEKETLKENVRQALQPANPKFPRRILPLHVIHPSTSLLTDILHFDPKEAKNIKKDGIADCLTFLEHHGHITEGDHKRWIEEIK